MTGLELIIKDRFKTLATLYANEDLIKSQIKEHADALLAQKRIFVDGEKVKVFTHSGTLAGEGVVKSARLLLRFDRIYLEDYISDEPVTEVKTPLKNRLSLEYALDTVQYEVYRITRDGRQSNRHFDGYEYFIVAEKDKLEGKYYITKA